MIQRVTVAAALSLAAVGIAAAISAYVETGQRVTRLEDRVKGRR